MIFLFGSRAGHLKTLKISEPCRACKATNSVELIVYQRFAHIFWIPIFPTRKVFTSQCFRCKDSLLEEGVKSSYPQTYRDAKKRLWVPVWSFSGIILVGSIVLLISILSYIRDIKEQFMIQSPESGDIYKYRSKDGAYSLLKVSEVRGDTIYIFSNSYSTNDVMSMRRLLRQSHFNFSKESSPWLRSDLIQMFENGEIITIERE